MKKYVKKVFLSVLVATAIVTTMPASASKITVNMPGIIYESKTIEHLSSGVKHEHIQRFTTSGWWNLNVLRIDMEDGYTELKGIFNKEGIPKRDKISTMVDKHNALAAINGDYFNYAPLPSAMGTLINDGEIISSPVELSYGKPSFYLTSSNVGNVGYLDRDIVLSNKTMDRKLLINTLNKVDSELNTLGIVNKHWGSQSIGNRFHQDLVEVVVEDHRVREVRVGQPPVSIPQENGYVVMGRGPRAEMLTEFSVGDEVDLNVDTNPSSAAIKFAIGGGSVLLKNGELSLPNINSAGNQPRSGIGVNKDNTEIILVTLDGRDSSFKGVSQEMFGAILRDLGAYDALNLDGGGSTTMAIKPIGENKSLVVNKPSENSERSVVNGVGVFTNAPKGELSYLKISVAEALMFANTTRNIDVKGYDQYHNPTEINTNLVKFSLEGVDGSFEGNKFKATSAGNANIIASYEGMESVKGSTEVKVLGAIKELTSNVDSFTIKPNSQETLPSFSGKNDEGRSARIYLEDLDFQVIGDIGSVKDGVFYSNDNMDGGALVVRAGEATKNILVSTGTTGVLVDSFESLDNYSSSSYPETTSGEIGLREDAKDGKSSIALRYDFSKGTATRASYINLYPNTSGLKLKDNPQKLGFWVKGDNSGIWLRASISDASGKEHLLTFAQTMDWSDWKYVESELPKNITYPVTWKRIYVAETDSLKKQSGEILVDALTAYYPKFDKNLELPTSSRFTDPMNKKADVGENGFSFVVGHEPYNLDTIAGYEASKLLRSQWNQSKVGISLNGFSEGFKSGLKNYASIDGSNAYKTNKHGDVLFINLSSAKGGIRATNPQQWIWLKDALATRTESNVILFLPTPVFGSGGFSDKLEADLLQKTLEATKEKGKNIFVVHGGNRNAVELKNGIRYIGMDTRNLTSAESLKNLSLIRFVVNQDSISYQINKIFQ